MPVINVECGKLSIEQKREIVQQFTDTAATVMKIPKEAFVIMIKENEMENIGSGGKLLSDR